MEPRIDDWHPALRRYCELVSIELTRVYGIAWEDASGDVAPLEAAIKAGQSPAEFVRWWGEKYGLVRVADIGLSSLGCDPA